MPATSPSRRTRIREGLLNYLALLGWSIAPDRDVFSMDEMTEKFDVRDVKANPARFDIDKAISINAEHIRMLEPEDFLRRSVPYLHRVSCRLSVFQSASSCQ